MRVLSMDLSLTATGIAVAVDGVVTEGFTIPGIGKDVPRLIGIRNRVMDKVDSVQPHLVLMEGLAMRSQDGLALDRIGSAYMIRAELVSDKVPWIEVAPSSLKKFVVGRGGSSKNPIPKALVVKYLALKFGHADVDDDNICDAIGMCYVGMALMGEWEPKINAQHEVLRGLREKNPMLKSLAAATTSLPA